LQELDTIITGDALKILKTLPDDFANCVVCSPPFWSLRAYHTEPQIWDEPPFPCEHDWGETIHTLQHKSGETNPGLEAYQKEKGASDEVGGQFCSKCGAWRGELGQEPSFKQYVRHLLTIFDEVYRVLKPTGTCFVELGDTYASGTRDKTGYDPTRSLNSKEGKNCKGWHIQPNRLTNELPQKCLCNIPFRFAIGMTENGWIQRNTLIWHKLNCLPQSCKDRFTVDFTYIFFFVKSQKYYFEQQFEPLSSSTIPRMSRAISDNHKWSDGAEGQTVHSLSKPRPNRKMAGTLYGGDGTGLHEHSGYYDKDGTPRFYLQGRNKRCVWSLPTKSFPGAHYATFNKELITPMILAGCPQFICKKCGKIREKVVKTVGGTIGQSWHDHTNDSEKGMMGRGGIPDKGEYQRIDNGYTDCGCNAGFDSGIVLDPFCGAGTTCVVAKELGRHYVGIELNPDYVAMGEERLMNTVQQMRLV